MSSRLCGRSALVISSLAGALGASAADAQLVVLGQFDAGSGGWVGMGSGPGGVWAYAGFGAVLSRYSSAGAPLGTIPRPGEAADDADIDIARGFTPVGAVMVPPGTLLFINGESGTAEIYAVDPTTGSVVATLATGFGAGHVVGGGYHEARGTFFLVQDRVAGADVRNRVAEIDPRTGSVLNSFHLTTFVVNYGDLDVAPSGNLLIVSSDESSIQEITPTGVAVRQIALPAAVGGLSGISVDDSGCELRVLGTDGMVWRLGLPGGDPLCVRPCPADFNGDGFLDFFDADAFTACFEGIECPPGKDADFNGDGFVDFFDLDAFVAAFEAGC